MCPDSDKPEMIPAQRRSMILELIRQHASVSVNDLAKLVGVSLSTARRDLSELSKTGFIRRSHGGAILSLEAGTVTEPDREIASHFAREEKMAIGRLAAKSLRDGQSVLFDSSSTVMEVARCAVEKGLRLTAVTNDVKMAELLAHSPTIKIVVLGGSIRPGSPTLVGEPGISFLESLHVDVTLIGIHAVKGSKLCETQVDLAIMKRRMIASAHQKLLVADAGKFDLTAFCDVCDLREIDEIVTDRSMTDSQQTAIRELGVTLKLA